MESIFDGCLANFNKGYAHLLNQEAERFPEGWKKDFQTYVVPPWIDTWDWDKKYGYTSAERSKVWDYIKSSEYWFKLDPLPLATEAVEVLEDLSLEHEVYFITHRMGKEAKQLTEDWLFGLGMTCPTVLISTDDKTPLVQGLDLDMYVDDKKSTIFNLSVKALPKTKLYIIDSPYNQGPIEGVTRLSSVLESVDDFMRKYNKYVDGLI